MVAGGPVMSTQGNALAGSTAATLQAVEIHKLLDASAGESIAGREILFDAGAVVHCATRLLRNPRCRFDHARFQIEPCDASRLGEALARVPGRTSEKQLSVPDATFVSRLACTVCALSEETWHLRESLDEDALACPRCGRPRTPAGFDLHERLGAAAFAALGEEYRLADLGLREDEVFRIAANGGAARSFRLLGPGSKRADRRGAALVVAGLGNIGSFLVPLIARMQTVARVVLCDPDHYEGGQQLVQDVPAADVGRAKVAVQAERLRAIRPELEVEAITERVETLPLGRLCDAVVVSCLDSRAARLRLAARAWRVGSPFVDAAVGGGPSLLVRTNAFLPEPEAACFECAFEDRDYASLEQVFACETETDHG